MVLIDSPHLKCKYNVRNKFPCISFSKYWSPLVWLFRTTQAEHSTHATWAYLAKEVALNNMRCTNEGADTETSAIGSSLHNGYPKPHIPIMKPFLLIFSSLDWFRKEIYFQTIKVKHWQGCRHEYSEALW